MSLETLWAPWRLDYVKNPDRKPEAATRDDAPPRDDCFLCRYRDDPAADAAH